MCGSGLGSSGTSGRGGAPPRRGRGPRPRPRLNFPAEHGRPRRGRGRGWRHCGDARGGDSTSQHSTSDSDSRVSSGSSGSSDSGDGGSGAWGSGRSGGRGGKGGGSSEVMMRSVVDGGLGYQERQVGPLLPLRHERTPWSGLRASGRPPPSCCFWSGPRARWPSARRSQRATGRRGSWSSTPPLPWGATSGSTSAAPPSTTRRHWTWTTSTAGRRHRALRARVKAEDWTSTRRPGGGWAGKGGGQALFCFLFFSPKRHFGPTTHLKKMKLAPCGGGCAKILTRSNPSSPWLHTRCVRLEPKASSRKRWSKVYSADRGWW